MKGTHTDDVYRYRPSKEVIQRVKRTLFQLGFTRINFGQYVCIFYDTEHDMHYRIKPEEHVMHNYFRYNKIILPDMIAYHDDGKPLIIDIIRGSDKSRYLERDLDYDFLNISYRRIREEVVPTEDKLDRGLELSEVLGF